MSARIERKVDNLKGARTEDVVEAFKLMGNKEARADGNKVRSHFGGTWGAVEVDLDTGKMTLDDVHERQASELMARTVQAGFQRELTVSLDPFDVEEDGDVVRVYVYARG